MSSLKSCCTIAPVDSTYQPVGTVENVGIHELPTYIVGPKDAKKAIVVLYDIFGFHNNTKQFCDVLANNCGYKVVMPDFFRGEPYKPEWMGDMDRLMAWIQKVGSLKVIQPQVEVVRQWLQEQGVVQGGLVGFCWGAKISVQLTALDSFFGGASLIHPSFVDVKDAENAGAPILALPSQNEPDRLNIWKSLLRNLSVTNVIINVSMTCITASLLHVVIGVMNLTRREPLKLFN
ncbi:Alpha/Beta hydrolase protein [Circinella umbellata]|nr:Alpha/Beta hydrolase protein [Circinella umbellata]